MAMTEEQRLAVETEGRSLVVEAGAGTGKTSVLVDRFMVLLARHRDWPLESIVAITFTEKAMREMRSRIRRKVEEMAAALPGDEVWQARRRSLDRLMVSTIHGLCARMLRENAIAAGVDPRFNVLKEADSDLLKDEALRQALAEAAVAPEERAGLELLASLRVKDLENEMAALLSKRGTLRRLLPEVADTPALLARWQAGEQAMVAQLWRQAIAADAGLAGAIELAPEIEIAVPDDLLAEAVGLAKHGCARFRDGRLSEAWRLWASMNLRGGRYTSWGGPEALDRLKVALKSLKAAGKDLAELTGDPGVDDAQAAQALLSWRALWDNVEDTYARMKEERQSLDFDDLEILAERLLRREPPDHRVAAFRAGIRQLMVDEFQDTNKVQQSIVYALAAPGDPGRLFVVGDPKQSIYRFRQAQVSLFHETAGDVRQATGCDPLPLSCSFRAHRSLVQAQNTLFDRLLQPLGTTHAPYEAPPGRLTAARETPPAQACAPASVEMWLLPGKDAEGKTVAMGDARAWEARLLAQRLKGLREGGFTVWDRDARVYRPFRFSDAAILFRATSDLPLYEEQFKAEGLPYLTVSGRGYYDRPEIRDLAALLACLRAPGDDLNLAAVLRSPLFSLSDETLYLLRWRLPDGRASQVPAPFATALKAPPPTAEDAQVRFAAGVLGRLWPLVGAVPVWELLQTALDLTGYDAALALSDAGAGSGARQRNNLAKFMAFARESGGASVSEFLARVQDLTSREAREGEALAGDPESGAVQLMSIHAAKGLEFPVVAVADLGRRARGGQSGSPLVLHDPAFGVVCKLRDENGDWQEPPSYKWGKWLDGLMDEAESRRLLYVACTRAADLLILAGRCGEKASWLDRLLGALELAPEGGAEETVSLPDCPVRIFRPSEMPPDLRPPEGEALPQRGLTVMPPLASPLPTVRTWRPLTVTRLRRLVAGASEEPALLPAVSMRGVGGLPGTAPRDVLGTVVHRALADWANLDLPEEDLRRRLCAVARREGVVELGALADTVDRAAEMVAAVRRSPLHEEVSHSPNRRSEVPFTWASPAGTLHGVIDLLYEDAESGWRLIDWKTGRLRPGSAADVAARYRLQVAVYAMAAERLLGARPTSALCFVQAGAMLHRYGAGELDAAWQDAVTALGGPY